METTASAPLFAEIAPEVATATPSPPTLVTLPPELRNRIYELVLPVGQVIDILPAYNEAHQSPPITCVNRQLRRETLPIYYGNNTFQSSIGYPPGNMVAWISSLSDLAVISMQCVRSNSTGYGGAPPVPSAEAREWDKDWSRRNEAGMVRKSGRGLLGPGFVQFPVWSHEEDGYRFELLK
ncbi:hypothetical protein LTR86_001719 [Recurvomyces mirabilis]|nr:hypothetical protein LTR86_001719 [Recurvomyces mirabilis]